MKRILIIGGDGRLKTAERILSREYRVETLGLYENDNGNIADSEIIVLPVPTTRDRKTVFAPLSQKEILLSEIEAKLNDRLVLTCGYNFQNNNCIDYGALDSYSLLNAVPTAEGAIKLAIENTDFTLWQSRVLVIGFGRCGKVLAERLKSLGAFVTVSARKPVDLSLIEVYGYKPINTYSLKEIPLDYDIIFNTVDSEVITEKVLQNCSAKLLLDISSKGGFNIDYAEKRGIKAIKAPGLPGKIAPKTAGEILAKTVTQIIRNQF